MKTTTPIYNGYSIRQILNKMPERMKLYKLHRNEYVKNCIKIHLAEKKNINIEFQNSLRNRNFLLIKFYLKLDNIIN